MCFLEDEVLLDNIAEFGVFGEFDDCFISELIAIKSYQDTANFFVKYFKKYNRFLKYFVNDLIWKIGEESSQSLNEFLQLCVDEQVVHLIDWNFFLTNYGLSTDAGHAVSYLLEYRPDLVKTSLWLQANIINTMKSDESDAIQLFDLSSLNLSKNTSLNGLVVKNWMKFDRFDLISSAFSQRGFVDLQSFIDFHAIISNVNNFSHAKIDSLCALYEQHVKSNYFIEIWKVLYRDENANTSALEKYELEKREVCKRMFLWNMAKSKESHLEFLLESCLDDRTENSGLEMLHFFCEIPLEKGSNVARYFGEILSSQEPDILNYFLKLNDRAAETILRICYACENKLLWEKVQDFIINSNLFRIEYLQWPNNPNPVLAKLQTCTFANCESIFMEHKEYLRSVFAKNLGDFLLFMFDKFNSWTYIKNIAANLNFNIYRFCENELHNDKFKKLCSIFIDYNHPNIIQQVFLSKVQSNHLSKARIFEAMFFIESLYIDQSFTWNRLNISLNCFLESFRYLLDEGSALMGHPEVSPMEISRYLGLLMSCCNKFAHYDVNFALRHLINFSLHVQHQNLLGLEVVFHLRLLFSGFKLHLKKDFLLMFEVPMRTLGLWDIFTGHPALSNVSDFDVLVNSNEFFIHYLNEQTALQFIQNSLWILRSHVYDGKQGTLLTNVFHLAQMFPNLRFDILKTCTLLHDKELCIKIYDTLVKFPLDPKSQVLLDRLLIRDTVHVEYDKIVFDTSLNNLIPILKKDSEELRWRKACIHEASIENFDELYSCLFSNKTRFPVECSVVTCPQEFDIDFVDRTLNALFSQNPTLVRFVKIGISYLDSESVGSGILVDWIAKSIRLYLNVLFVPNEFGFLVPSLREDCVKYAESFGILLGLLLVYDQNVHLNFSPIVWKILSGSIELEKEEIIEFDSASLSHIWSTKSICGLDFEYSYHGRILFTQDAVIDEFNSESYRTKVFEELKIELEKLFLPLVSCFKKTVPTDLFSIFHQHPSFLKRKLSGLDNIDINDWKINTKSNISDEHFMWFWEIIAEISDDEKRQLLIFTTGSNSVPSEGFQNMSKDGNLLPFTISYKSGIEEGMLPRAATCLNELFIPRYASKEEMKSSIMEAIYHVSMMLN